MITYFKFHEIIFLQIFLITLLAFGMTNKNGCLFIIVDKVMDESKFFHRRFGKGEFIVVDDGEKFSNNEGFETIPAAEFPGHS